MLVGRDRECRAVQRLLAAARVGQGGALVLTGEAGIGKTALLDDAASAATGMRVLRATGSESESEVPFGALLQLLRPALVHLDRIPGPQAEALAAALALAPGTGGDRFAIGAATLSLLSRFAEDLPLAVLVDDAQLLDLPSAQALTFAARRLAADPVGVLVAVRDGLPGPLAVADLPSLAVGGLSVAATGDLLAARGRPRAGADRLHALTGGNPLAVVELADEVEALPATPPGTPVPIPASLARVFAGRLDRLSAPARLAVLAAATGGPDLDVVTRACGLLDVDVGALAEAEDAGLLRVDASAVAFRHDLVRSAVYSHVAPSLRRTVHRAVAAALPAGAAARRAWHLGEAALGPDEDLARALADVARSARGRSAHAVAAGAYERAARLSPDPADRLDRLVEAGESAWQAGLTESAVALLTAAALLSPPPARSARIAGLRGVIAARTGSAEQARDLLTAAAAVVAAADPDTAVLMLADALLACFLLGDTATVLRAGAEIEALAGRVVTARARLVGGLAAGFAGVLTGLGGPDAIRRALLGVDAADPLVEDPQVAPWLVLGPLCLRERGAGRELVGTVVDSLRRRSVVGGLPLLLFHVARDQATTDRWHDAELTYAEGIGLAREAGQTADLAACLAGLAWLEARQGREAQCRAHAEEAVLLCGPRHIALFRCWSLFALGELELGLGRPAEALAHLDRLEALLGDLGMVDVDLSPAPEQADALARLGRTGPARAAAAGYRARALAKDQPWALARAARTVGLTCPDDEIDRHFGTALAEHARTPDSFELARTQLAYGSRLRRARRRVQARPHLRAALTALDALGAAPWADAAAAELRATGETVQRRGASAIDALTPQELQVARMLAAGRTTREAAAALFLSPKTVEYHLRHVYVKLGLRSRAELAAGLVGPPRPV